MQERLPSSRRQDILKQLFYAFRQPQRVLDYLLKDTKIAKLCKCSTEESKNYIKELIDSQFLSMLRSELDKFDLPLGHMLTPLRGPVIYSVIRILRPSIVVETGVASGVSTALILYALSLNGKGELYSIDLPTLT